MRSSIFKTCVSVLAVAVASPVFAQAAEEQSAGGLDEIVVTASGRDKSQLNTAAAITSVNADVINNFKPASESEIYRLIPGIQAAGTAGPGGNANIAVRGLPVATGGSPFVQLQEDGLPTVLFGDIQFGNNDYWTRYDASVQRLETVRGGSATTFASQAPGAIINYISNYGDKQGGYIQGQMGLNYNEFRTDFRYGGPIGESTRFHIGGYYKTGHGPLNNFKTSDSFQVKANLTQDIGDKGYVRLLVKFADTQEPNYTGSPALATKSGSNIGGLQTFPGFDGRTQSNYSSLNQTGLFYSRAGQLERQPIDGISTKSFSIGGQLHYEMGENITLDDNMRYTSQSGHFASPFFNLGNTNNTVALPAGFAGATACTINALQTTANVPAAQQWSSNGVVGSCVNGQVVGSVRYASGPNAGQNYTAAYIDNNVNVRTNIRDIGSYANDLALTGKFSMSGAKLTARAGFFYMKQKIAMDWHVNKSTREVNGNNPSQLDLYTAAGAKITQEGIAGYNNNWGNCCARDYDLSYTNTAPYASLELEGDNFGLDASIRFEHVSARGGGRTGGAEFNVNSSGVNIPTMIANGPAEVVNYGRSYKSWTAGAYFKPAENFNIYARASKGGRFNGDRQTFGGKFTTTGALCDGVAAKAGTNGCSADGVTPSVDFVNQYEVGIKNQGDLGGGRYTLQASLLFANFKQSTFELSATRCPGGSGGCVIDAKYKSSGVEFSGTYQNGGFSLAANATYTKAKQLDSGATAYRRADRLPDLSYTIVTNYDINEMFGLGLSMTGQSSTTDGTNVYSGGTIFNGNISVHPIKNVEIGVNAYNLFNRYDFRGNGNSLVGPYNGSASTVVVTGTAVVGRTFSASAKFNF